MGDLVTTIDRTNIQQAIEFYERSPDGQYDAFVADALRKLLKDSDRYHYLTAHVLDWDEDGTKRWMISDQFFDGPTLDEAIDAAIIETGKDV